MWNIISQNQRCAIALEMDTKWRCLISRYTTMRTNAPNLSHCGYKQGLTNIWLEKLSIIKSTEIENLWDQIILFTFRPIIHPLGLTNLCLSRVFTFHNSLITFKLFFIDHKSISQQRLSWNPLIKLHNTNVET